MTTDTAQITEHIRAISSEKNATLIAHSREELYRLLRDYSPDTPENIHPEALNNVIDSYMEHFDKLRFVFVEGDAKERFFRFILEQTDMNLTKEDVESAHKEAEMKKTGLEKKKTDIDAVAHTVEEQAITNDKLMQAIDEKTERVSVAAQLLEEKRAKIAALKQELQAKKRVDPSLSQLQQMDLSKYGGRSLSTVRDVRSLLESVNSQQSATRSKTLRLEKDKLDHEDRIQREQARLQSLNKRKEQLENAIESMKRLDGDDSEKRQEIQANDEKLLLLMKVWTEFTSVSSLNVEDNVITMKFADFPGADIEINMKDTRLIRSVTVNGEEISKEIIQLSNRDTTPLRLCSKMIYDYLQQLQ